MIYPICEVYKLYPYINFKFYFFVYLFFNLIFLNKIVNKFKKKKIGIISCNYHANVGNNLVKYAMFIILLKYGYDPQIIATNAEKFKLSFLKKKCKF